MSRRGEANAKAKREGINRREERGMVECKQRVTRGQWIEENQLTIVWRDSWVTISSSCWLCVVIGESLRSVGYAFFEARQYSIWFTRKRYIFRSWVTISSSCWLCVVIGESLRSVGYAFFEARQYSIWFFRKRYIFRVGSL
ncbi:hypothetical protein CRE_02699 [Caenorhabditis remanei]|uniref:Uncharacterized protein n=1 Tax=Caenorhabditis remanei TaxID=31234 RepID=E3NKZ6_CAERE|nr:hypothetical protein CRE_02699 [Caenorhabditis remanei]